MSITIEFSNGMKPKEFQHDSCVYLEDIIIALAKDLSIKPLCRHMFGLRDLKTSLWLCPSKKITELRENIKCQFRIRFFLPSRKLSELDCKAHEYLFYQVREEFLAAGKTLPDESVSLCLVVIDLLHHLFNHNKRIDEVNVRSFMPKSLNTLGFRRNIQKRVEFCYTENFEQYVQMGTKCFREEYLDEIEKNNFPFIPEKYSLEIEEGTKNFHVNVLIDPRNPEFPGLYSLKSSKKEHICRIEEIIIISIRKQNYTVELCHETGPPCYFKFTSVLHLESFVSCLNGYYRLMKIWSFDLCNELVTPSLSYLKSNKCHGPVGSAFTAMKLKEKNEAGLGILRESTYEYDSFILSVLEKVNQPPKDYSILVTDKKYHFIMSNWKEDSLLDLVKWAIKNTPEIGLKSLLPPSDFDRPEKLLLCSVPQKQVDKWNGPRIMCCYDFTEPEKTLKGRFSVVYFLKWISEDKKDVVIKKPRLENRELNSFMSILNEYVFVESDCLVKILGIILSPFSLVMELMNFGPLDAYLQANEGIMRGIDLVEASTYLAKALWDLSLKNIAHRNIRCHNILVAEHTPISFKVKLSDPGKIQYTKDDIHWIPRKHHQHPTSALADSSVDIWAFATTLWEIFSLGLLPLSGANIEEVRAIYEKDFILSRPQLCPKELYKIMLNCWHPELYCRYHPQTIMRDVKQVFYDIYNSRLENHYQKVGDSPDEELQISLCEEDSFATQVTTISNTDGSVSEFTMGKISHNDPLVTEMTINEALSQHPNRPSGSEGTLRSFLFPAPSASTIVQKNSSFDFDNAVITLGDQIGEGYYGLVFKGILKHHNGREEPVALKKLKSLGSTKDFMKEVGIMKNLYHEKIVKLYGLVESCLEGITYEYMVMEYLPYGSLRSYLEKYKTNLNVTSDKRLLSFALDIAMGMEYLESKKVIHRDLAARNVLIASEDHVKITDFGLAQYPNEGNYYIVRRNRELPIKWYALESIQFNKHSHKTDVWSYGVTCWEIFTRGRYPDCPSTPTRLIEHLSAGNRLSLHPPCHRLIYSNLIRPCWKEDASSRPSFSSITYKINELLDELGHEEMFCP